MVRQTLLNPHKSDYRISAFGRFHLSGYCVNQDLAHFTPGHESPILHFRMSKVIVTGKAQDDRETFVFTVEPFVSGGFLLSIRYAGDGEANVTGAGVWPSVEKAKQIAEETAGRLLHGAVVNWQG